MLELFPNFGCYTERLCREPLAALSLGPSELHAASPGCVPRSWELLGHSACILICITQRGGVLGLAHLLSLAESQSTNITCQSGADKMFLAPALGMSFVLLSDLKWP